MIILVCRDSYLVTLGDSKDISLVKSLVRILYAAYLFDRGDDSISWLATVGI